MGADGMIQDAYLCPDHVLPVSHLPSDIDPAMLSALSSADLRGMEREAKDKVCFPPPKKNECTHDSFRGRCGKHADSKWAGCQAGAGFPNVYGRSERSKAPKGPEIDHCQKVAHPE